MTVHPLMHPDALLRILCKVAGLEESLYLLAGRVETAGLSGAPPSLVLVVQTWTGNIDYPLTIWP